MANETVNNTLNDLQREYQDFLDDDNDEGNYREKITEMLALKKRRLIVNINDMRTKNPKRAAELLNNTAEEMLAFELALKSIVMQADPSLQKEYRGLRFSIGLEGSFGNRHVTPRSLTCTNLGGIVCVEGIVTKASLIKPKIVRSVHYCPATEKFLERNYTDISSYDSTPSSSIYPTKDDDGNLLETEFGLSTYKDHQTLTIQEMPEKAPAGQLPRSVDILCDDDMVDLCKPGDRVQIVGLYRCLPFAQAGYTNGIFRTVLLANNVRLLSKEVATELTADDMKKVRQFAREKGGDVFSVLSKSLAPSIHGHDFVKKALLCLLLGGSEKVLPKNRTRLRGDINILLIGDPSVAKSQMLRFVLNIAPRAIATTGRGSSGVGLTAAVTTDQETGDRRLEAGAMVLADRGVVCIDEFDKMSDIDRTAIHEVMEQGRVTIAKSGIQAQLNARCSVLAAANPVYGRYDQYKTPMENIGLQDSLLSRFDLLFVLLDTMDPENDLRISEHVVRMHRYRNPNEQDGEAMPLKNVADYLSTEDPKVVTGGQTTEIYEKHDALLHGPRKNNKERRVSLPFLKKYIHLARQVKPALTDEAGRIISEEYPRLRSFDSENSDMARTQPITARTLETLIRLATAHAKARLSAKVTEDDAKKAIELVHFAYFKKVIEKRRKRRHNSNDDAGSSDEEEEDEPMDEGEKENAYEFREDSPATQIQKPKKKARKEQPEEEEAPLPSGSSTPASIGLLDRLDEFRTLLNKAFRKTAGSQQMPLKDLMEFLAGESLKTPFTQEEVELALERMSDANQVMVSEEIIYLI
ncbi:zygotic DNA replication licensing factor mcm3 [Galendromus occidentalis]|uniref:DNA replication licensing factor MCM3 n=1 Tax=Galendromus occidentalis TaxID=34638 RepID=A0AAJ6W143_9ACAR|nr:zygotic DNA replication licensing factor mcm3 [Galendromus occidentalis]